MSFFSFKIKLFKEAALSSLLKILPSKVKLLLKFSSNTPLLPYLNVITGTPNCSCKASSFAASSYSEITISGLHDNIFSASANWLLGPPTPHDGNVLKHPYRL